MMLCLDETKCSCAQGDRECAIQSKNGTHTTAGNKFITHSIHRALGRSSFPLKAESSPADAYKHSEYGAVVLQSPI